MVAQCKNCQTKFKFDETLIEGEGIWVRCSQCKNVFFVDNPSEAGKTSSRDREKNMGAEDVKESASLHKRAAQGQIMLDQKEDTKGPETVTGGDFEKEVGDIGKYKSIRTENVHDDKSDRDKITEEKTGMKPVASQKRQMVYLLIVLLMGGVYFTFFTDTDWQATFEKILGMSKKSEEVGPAQVAVSHLQHRPVRDRLPHFS